MSIRFAPTGWGWIEKVPRCSYGELNGIPIALVARIHHHLGGSYYPIPFSILSTEKDHKTPQRYPDVPTTSWRISI
uniref:Uncharacterized protein n=1 Tax=Tanacetum cinerariifolium TaxID=118510 RepID=A0A699QU17_TANCI|nr:hypothetical protein [Tanacetum cinerariifolium]